MEAARVSLGVYWARVLGVCARDGLWRALDECTSAGFFVKGAFDRRRRTWMGTWLMSHDAVASHAHGARLPDHVSPPTTTSLPLRTVTALSPRGAFMGLSTDHVSADAS